ncbi:MAG: oligosaccharide flippase family protein [Candidatus Levyibacteriota bacterium]
MKKKILYLIKNPLISGSTIIFFGLGLANLLNYFFNLSMGRLLSVSDYGTLGSLISIVNIFNIVALTITVVFTKFTASFLGQNKETSIPLLFRKGTLWIGAISLFILVVLVISSGQIAHFLNIKDKFLIDIISLAVFFLLLLAVVFGIVQGLLKFTFYSISNILVSLVKLVLGVVLVFLGFRVFGSVLAIMVSLALGYFFTFFYIRRFFLKNKTKDFAIPNLASTLSGYGIPVLLANLGIISIISMDLIVVKHFFSDTISGQYAALSLMGRSISYVVTPILLVLFPLIAQKKERREKLLGTVFLSALLIGVPSISLSALYFLFPNIVLKIFFPAQAYATLAQFLGPFSIFILFYTFASLLNSFYLSIGKTKVFIFNLIALFLEILFITFFHANISQVVTGLIGISFLLLLALLLYYPHATKK